MEVKDKLPTLESIKYIYDLLREAADQKPGCYIVTATDNGGGRLTVDHSTSEIRAAVDAGNDARLYDAQTGMYHHFVYGNMLEAVFAGVETDTDNPANMCAVAYLLSGDNTVVKTRVAINGALSGFDTTTLQQAVDTALAQAKASGEFDGDPGADGGYYTVNARQQDANTMVLSFTPSKTGMPQVQDISVTLPQGPQGPGAETFTVTFSHASGGYVADKTNAEIYAAVTEGKTVVGVDPVGRFMQLYRYSSNIAWFTALGYDHDDEEFAMQIYRLGSDSITVDFETISSQDKLVQSVIAALPVYGGETQ